MRARGGRRGAVRAALAPLALVLLLAGCGGGGGDAGADAEKSSDVEILNAALARELTLLDAYTRVRPGPGDRVAPIARRFRAQEREYVNALTKAIRGLGGETEAEQAELDLSEARTRRDFLELAHELEGAALASYVEAAPRLFTAAPRTLATALAAGHAQHLVVLRLGLGAGGAEAAPEAFDGGEVPLPGAAARDSH